MEHRFSIDMDLHSPEETARLAAAIAPVLHHGDTLLLSGEIGAGKTHFARSLIQSRLGRIEDVPSPTFTLVQTYEADDADIWHADLYRLGHPDEVLELGLDAAFDTAICLVEWPDRLGDTLPAGALNLHFQHGQTSGYRTLTLNGERERWSGVLDAAAATRNTVDA